MAMLITSEFTAELEYFGPDDTDPAPLEIAVSVGVVSIGMASTVKELLLD